MDPAGKRHAKNVKHDKTERNVRERSMRFADGAFTLLTMALAFSFLRSSANAWITMAARWPEEALPPS